MTATPRCGLHKYTFPSGANAAVIVDLTEGVTSDKILESWIEVIDDRTIVGYKSSMGWAKEQNIWFRAEFSQAFKDYTIISEGKAVNSKQFSTNEPLKIVLEFGKASGNAIMAKVGISPVDRDGALINLDAEIQDFDFDLIRKNARDSWNNMLKRIEVEGGSTEDKTIFYTALYHSFLAPNLFSDADGRYRGHDFKTHKAEGHKMYTVFSLWDTFRALHPLFTIVQQDLTNDLINSMLKIYEQGGLLPVWELAANETWCMIGYHSIPVIADAYFKGLREYNVEKAFEAMKKSAEQDHHGLRYYKQFGYIPADKEGESVSKTLEYAYDDWCIAMMAQDLGKEDDYKNFIQRAQYYKNIYDPETRFMRGKMNGMFVKPFNPTEVNFMLTEANTWQYTFFVPQDINGLMALMGGKEDFIGKLDTLFNTDVELSGRHQSDITGLVGQYAHGNEPSHHMAYLYNFAGQPWKTQKLLRKIMDELYGHEADGLCGNEDCGQMSAWYVLSSMGFYPVTPGTNEYIIGSPVFDKVTINLENGNKFIIQANSNNDKNIYIQSARMNDAEYTKSYITHEDIMEGGDLVFEMGDTRSDIFGVQPGDLPSTYISEHLITPVPYIVADSRSFTEEMILALDNIYDDAEIFYRGTADQLDAAVTDMSKNFALAVLLLALIMAVMFGSVKDSLIVLLVMPLAIVGGVIGLRVLNLFTYQSLELLTMIGFIILLGLVVNNAILLVHQTRAAEREGLNRADAVAQAIRIRTRPIFMSTLTSVCGMLPLMLVPGAGSEIYRGLATVIVGGMSVSAVFTLLLLPSILRLGESRQQTISNQVELRKDVLATPRMTS